MRRFARTAIAALGLVLAGSAAARQFHVFPIKEIEGVSAASQQTRAARRLVDAKLMGRLFGGPAGQQAQRRLVDHFVARLAAAYPQSIVHPRQVSDVAIGSGHKFVNDDDLACKAAPTVGVNDTYAVMLGITRAAVYEVVKGDNVEVLVPMTLNLQFVRPSMAKVVYTLSETVYSPFRLTRNEYESGAADQAIRETLLSNIGNQVDSLVASARQGFDPKDVSVRLVARDGQFYVADQGIEAGFVKGEQVEARDATGKAAIFDVIYADSGYAVIKPAAGSVAVGDSLSFIFESTVNDSRKPRLLPVLSSQPGNEWADAVAELFAKDIGFKASFQLSPVDVNFAQTKELLTRSANCVTWQKLPAMTEASGRKDTPDFFLRFTPAVTPVATLAGMGGTKTAEMFHTVVTAQVVDKFGRVIHSAVGDNDYRIEKVNGEGLSFEQAKEISLKNATLKLAQDFLANVRFAPRDYKVEKVDKDKVWVSGLGGMPLKDKVAFDLLHPLDARVGGKPVLLDLEAGSGAGDMAVDGGLVGVPYAVVNPALPRPRKGDLLRLYTDVPPASTPIVDCDEGVFVAPNSAAAADYLAPLVRHAVYRSKKFASYVGDPGFYSDTNNLLAAGLFDLRLERPAAQLCSQPGYMVREDGFTCDDPQNCKATITLGLVARLKRGTQVEKTISTGLRTDYTGVPAAGRNAFYGYKQLSNGLSMQADLINKLNLNQEQK